LILYHIHDIIKIMETSTITGKGQTTIPAKIRDHLSLNRGDRVRYRIDESGNVMMRGVTGSIRDIQKSVPPAKTALSDEEIETKMAAAISKDLIDDDRN